MSEASSAVNPFGWHSALVLTGNPVDTRSEVARNHLSSLGSSCSLVHYDADNMTVTAGFTALVCDDLHTFFRTIDARVVLFDATTLSFADLLVSALAAREAGCAHMGFMYVEPVQYRRPDQNSVHRSREFDLTTQLLGFRAIPGRGYVLDESKGQSVLFFLGYEGARLERAFEELNITPERCEFVFGLPAFQAGWEMDTYENNIRVFANNGITTEPFYCGANNPAAVCDLLEQRYRARGQQSDFFVAPLGTKPHGIGALLFVLEHADVGVLYDHPIPKLNRSEECGTWHFFDVRW